jgi:hypothetical protein
MGRRPFEICSGCRLRPTDAQAANSLGRRSAVRLGKPLPSWTPNSADRQNERSARAVKALRDIIAAEVDPVLATANASARQKAREKRKPG